MKNFDTELDALGVTRIVTVTETVQVTPSPITTPRATTMAYVGKPDSEWQWDDLRDYVVYEIEKRYGSFARRPPTQEFGIFSSFIKRWGAKGPAIARHAFDVCGGQWHNRQVTVESFCKGSDSWFSQPISERLV